MTAPLVQADRQEPVPSPPQVNLPPAARGRVALGITAAATQGRFELQQCAECGAVQYPSREACHQCLSASLPWRLQTGAGVLLSSTTLRHSNDPYFQQHLPRRLGLVRLDVGPTLMVHLHGGVADTLPGVRLSATDGAADGAATAMVAAPTRVRVGACLDRSGQAVLVGFPHEGSTDMADDTMLREMTCDPRLRKLLVTDATTEVGQALVRALVQAGADTVWAGHAQAWKKTEGPDDIAGLPQVKLVPLDLADDRSVTYLADSIGDKVDIIVNNAEVHHGFGISAPGGTDAARAEMDINYFGLLRLAQAFGPALRARSGDGASGATAWVNLLSIYALSNFPPHGSFSASKAAANSLSQCLRAEMRPAGIRVVNVFPGPVDDAWNRHVPAPKLAAGALAGAIVKALRDGVEDVYPGDVAQEWLARWRDNPKVLERELAAGGS